ncbi:hypothetical protein JVT61DRAFT_9582 [Boletus reticuloceps]|uniref:Uncharacterized protein n=1 Tax=Boletus reticuloceps TaxID=495285 RepID=A0A8I3A5R7_9AGAM|nr:hypothetical protein JVT61DRAFT_9582 [Boletus reticuloceps]
MADFQFNAAQNLTTPQFDTILDPTTFLCDTADDLSSPPRFPPACSLAVAPHFNVPHGLTAPHLDAVHNLTLTPNFDLAAAPQIPSGVSHQIECHLLIRVPGDLVTRLREEKVRCVADLVFDVGMFLWVHMQGEGIGRVPTDILCKEKLVRAIERRQRLQANWEPEAVQVAMLVVLAAQRGTKVQIKETQTEIALNNPVLFEAVATELTTVTRRFREHAFKCAKLLIHTTVGAHVGLIPHPNEVTEDFKNTLFASLQTGPFGPRIFHGIPGSNDAATAALFESELFISLVQHRLYNPRHSAWLGFVKDDEGPDGPSWTPLTAGSSFSVAYITAWVIFIHSPAASG